MAKRIEKMRDQDTAELNERQNELAEQVFRLRFQLSTGQAEAVTKLRSARKDLARVKTLLARARIEESIMATETAAAAQRPRATNARK